MNEKNEPEIVGQLTYPGDVRTADRRVYDTDRHGLVAPVMASYDEDTDRTTVQFAQVHP